METASTVPEWMGTATYGDETLTFLPDTLRAVIYITQNSTAVVSREFEIVLSSGSLSYPIRLVTDLSGELCYNYELLASSYETATVRSGKNRIDMISDGTKYYAYNEEHNYYVFHTDSFKGIEKKYIQADGAKFDLALMYSKSSAKWNSGRSKTIFDTMEVYNDVAAWYRDTFGYRGIDGTGGRGVLVVMGQFGNIAQNQGDRGYITVAGTTKNGVGVVQAPEILAHEYAHAVMRNICDLKITNEQAALHEGIADAFASLYMGDGKWHVGAAVAADGSSDRNIPAINKTMDDYQYDRTSDYVDNQERPDEPGFLDTVKLIISQGTTGNIDFTMDCSTGHCHENGEIISHTLYEIWKKVFDKDDVAFGTVLYRSLYSLPSNAVFSDFQKAFLHAMRLTYPDHEVAAAEKCFRDAGIESNYRSAYAVLNSLAEKNTTPSILMMLDMDYGQLQSMDLDEWYSTTSFDFYNTWTVHCSRDDCSYTLHINGDQPDDETALPWLIIVQDLTTSGACAGITEDIRTGMTYGEAAPIAGLSYPNVTQTGWAEAFYDNGYVISLHFDGEDNDAVIIGAEITSYG